MAAVSLCLIACNEEPRLSTCLPSALGLVGEIIVIDTGSTDRTKEEAVRFGARVFDFPWVDNFAAARNESLRHATGDWIFWLDADEYLDDDNRESLRSLFSRLSDQNAAYTMRQRSRLEPSTHSVAMVDHVRLFRNHPQIRWQYRVHEQILPAIRRAGGELRTTDIVIEHSGFLDPAIQGPKVERNLWLLELENEEHPHDPFVLFNLAAVYVSQGRNAEALSLLRESLKLSHPDDTIAPKLFALLTRTHHQLGQPPEALAACQAGQKHFPEDAELLFWEGMLLREQGDLPGAERCLRQVLETRVSTHFTGVDEGMRGYKARHYLAEVYRAQRRPQEAEAQWQQVVTENPSFAPSWLKLAELYFEQQRWPDLEKVSNLLSNDPQAGPEAAVWRARSHLVQGQAGAARGELEEILPRMPADTVWPRVLLSYALLQEGKDWEAAEQALRDVLRLAPHDPEAWHNLAQLLHRQRFGAEALAACQAGLFYCPQAEGLRLLEAMMLREKGQRT